MVKTYSVLKIFKKKAKTGFREKITVNMPVTRVLPASIFCGTHHRKIIMKE
jgi:hypothetical protein